MLLNNEIKVIWYDIIVLERILEEIPKNRNHIEQNFNLHQEIVFNFSPENSDKISSTNLQEDIKCGINQYKITEDNNQIDNHNEPALFTNIDNQNPQLNAMDTSILHDPILNYHDENNNDIQLNGSQTLQNNQILQEEESDEKDTINSVLKTNIIGFFFFIFVLLNLKFNISYYYAIGLLWLFDLYDIVITSNYLTESIM